MSRPRPRLARAIDDGLVVRSRAVFDGVASIPRVDLHMHTTWTDGAASAAEMHERADAVGLDAILFSEHARATSGEWFLRFAAEIRTLPNRACRALVGVETKVIQADGRLDLCDEIVAECDLVMASVHRFPGESDAAVKSRNAISAEAAAEIEMALAMAGCANPQTDILGHPFGMTIRRFSGMPTKAQWLAVAKAAAEAGVAFEINARYHDDLWEVIAYCALYDGWISFGSNAHSLDEVGRIQRLLQAKGAY